LIQQLAPDQLKELQKDPNLAAVPLSLNVGYLALNPSYEPFKSRSASSNCLRNQQNEIIKAFWGDTAESSPHFIPPTFKEFQSQNVTNYNYDPQKAKQLLLKRATQMALTFNFGICQSADLTTLPLNQLLKPSLLTSAQSALKSACKQRILLPTSLTATNPGYQAYMYGWSADYGDPDNFYYPHFGPGATADLGNWKK
jgi:peptide/nickel transport system substrate-binding protein